jgi:SAM-dependent methyltransferase
MTTGKMEVSKMDQEHLGLIRSGVSSFMADCARQFDAPGHLLDIAPQDHEGAAAYFRRARVDTLDIDPQSGATYIADLCGSNDDLLPPGCFDWIACTEVLEHVLDPFAAVREMRRMLKPGGYLFITTPFNFRIHGPLPDCWRFTEHGLRVLLKDLTIVSLEQTDCVGRMLMPIHYRVIARKEDPEALSKGPS